MAYLPPPATSGRSKATQRRSGEAEAPKRRKSPVKVTEAATFDPPPDVPLGAMSDEFEVDPSIPPLPGVPSTPLTSPEATRAVDPAPLAPVPGLLTVTLPKKAGQTKRGAAREAGAATETTIRAKNIRELWEAILDDPLYHAKVVERAQKGILPPPLEQMMWLQVEGKPPERGDAKPQEPTSVRIVHEFATGAPPKVTEGG